MPYLIGTPCETPTRGTDGRLSHCAIRDPSAMPGRSTLGYSTSATAIVTGTVMIDRATKVSMGPAMGCSFIHRK